MNKLFGVFLLLLTIPLHIINFLWSIISLPFHALFKTDHYKEIKRRADEEEMRSRR